MDHLLLPKDPLLMPMDTVQYICSEKYDGGPFLSYPHRKHKPWVVPDVNDPLYIPYATYEQMRPTPKLEQESFMQAWLFFGILNEVLGDLYREEDFLFKDTALTDRFMLCTKKLRPLLKAACRLRFGKTSSATRKLFDHLRKCLTLVITVSFAFHSDFDWGLMCSIAAVHEATVYTLNHVAQRLGSANIPNLPWAKKFFGVAICTRMLEGGWCPSEIERAKDKFRSTQSLFFLSRMRKNEIRREHLTCTTSLCSSFQLDLATYQTKHRRSCCMCPDKSPNMNDVVALLRSRKLPLLKITQIGGDLESLKVEVIAYTPETPYVAISHVWADGLGNPKGNSVPACQLSYILERVDALRGSAAFFSDPVTRARDAEGRLLFIWLDTLCCPVSPEEAHSLALAQMRRTYQDARHVLVLDSGLQFYASDEITIFEALSRVFLSGWVSRLWTLQEASLARTIWIQFKDRPLDLDALMAYLSQLGFADLAFLPFAFDMHGQFRSLRPAFPYSLSEEDSPSKPVTTLLHELDMALQHRSTTVAADEPLCIGNLLDLPADEILNVPATAAARMGRVWELIAARHGGIPQQIIGFEQPRLTEKGKRWAPMTLLSNKKGNSDTSQTRVLSWTDPALGIPSADGLLVKFPGFRLHLRQPEDNMMRNPWKSIPPIPEYRLLFTSDVDGERYELCSPADLDANANESKAERLARKSLLHDLVRSGSCALILLQKLTQEMNWNGLLVQIMKDTNGVLHVEHKYHIILSTLLPPQKLIYDTAERLARSLRREPVTADVARLMPESLESDSEQESEEYKSAVDKLKLRMQAVTAEALVNNPKLGKAWKSVFGSGGGGEVGRDWDDGGELGLDWGDVTRGGGDDDNAAGPTEDLLWRVVAEWYYHDFIGTKLTEGQMWCVD